MWRAKRIGAATLLLACAGVLAAADDTKITVHVLSPFDKPVDNAEVILDFLGSHQVTKLGKRKAVHWEMRTNQDGIAHFPPVPQGTVRVQVNSKKYQTFGDKYDVAETEKTIDIKLNVPQPQYSAHPPLKPKDQ
jgi:uncharacterized GH25 family protein